MRVPFFHRDRSVVAVLCLALAVLLAGCASKNPLIDEPTTASTSAAPQAQPGTATNTESADGTDSGVSTTGPTGIRRFLGVFSPYRIDIQQGNFVSREMVEQLKEGMTRDQVRFVLGTPLLTDIFHADRWDYVFRMQKGSGAVISSRASVFFDGDRLVKVEGGELPTEAEYLAFISGDGK
jgi:outer membrane protein assembly factor BamE